MKLTQLIMVLLLGCCAVAPRVHAAALYVFEDVPDSFAGPKGIIVASNVLYGTTRYSITTNGWLGGAVFKLNTDGSGFTKLHTLDGVLSAGVIFSDGVLYGTTAGTVFSLRADGSEFTNLFTFPDFGDSPNASLVMSGNTLYGTADSGGWDNGIVFSIDTAGSNYRVLHSFTGAPSGTNYDGVSPLSALTLCEGVLYGTAEGGGQFGRGTVFKLNTDGSAFETLHDFGASDGTNPVGSLVISAKIIYGTTSRGGSDYGTIYSVNTDGTGFKVLHTFNGSDGDNPIATLVLKGGALYGTTAGGGTNSNGTVFFLNADGTGFKTLYSFSPSLGLNTPTPWNADGWAPGPLVLSGTNLFGVCLGGGAGLGTIFTVPVSTSAAQLNITRSGAEIVATWPTGAPGYSLQYATNLSSPVWSSIESSAVVVNGQNAVMNAILDGQMFFRLSQ